MWCDLSHKNNKIKANHNLKSTLPSRIHGVIYHTKIVKSKQIAIYISNELGLVPNCFLKLREKWLSDEKPVMSEISDKV